MKKISNLILIGSLALFSIAMVGCGGDSKIVPLSGKVTLDGDPIAGVEVVFMPLPTATDSNVGPFSTGVTDASGMYKLETRYGDPGAALGKHQVYFQFEGYDPEAEDAAMDAIREAQSGGDAVPADAAADLKAAKKRKRIPKRYNEDNSEVEYEVPAGGTDKADFDLTS